MKRVLIVAVMLFSVFSSFICLTLAFEYLAEREMEHFALAIVFSLCLLGVPLGLIAVKVLRHYPTKRLKLEAEQRKQIETQEHRVELQHQQQVKLEHQRQAELERKQQLVLEAEWRKLANYEQFLESVTKIELDLTNSPRNKLDVNDMPELKIARIPRDPEQANNLCDFVVIDVETTGLSPKQNKLLEICAVRFAGFEPIEYVTTLIDPGSPIPEKITKINGISDEVVKGSPSIGSVYQSFLDFIGKEKVIIAHNIEFDIKFLYANGIDLFTVKRKYYDTCAMARTRLKRHSEYKDARHEGDYDYIQDYDVYDYKLGTLLKYYNIYSPKSHRALNDCIGTGQLFKKLLDES